MTLYELTFFFKNLKNYKAYQNLYGAFMKLVLRDKINKAILQLFYDSKKKFLKKIQSSLI